MSDHLVSHERAFKNSRRCNDNGDQVETERTHRNTPERIKSYWVSSLLIQQKNADAQAADQACWTLSAGRSNTNDNSSPLETVVVAPINVSYGQAMGVQNLT
jgi:hypothetical protein